MTFLKINFSNLSAESYSALILGIIFTIVCISSFIYCTKHDKISKTVSILTYLAFPFLAIFCWVYLIMSLSNFNPLFSLGIAFASGIGYIIIAIIVAVVVMRIKRDDSPKSRADVRDEDEPGIVAQSTESSKEKREEVSPLLIAHTAEEIDSETDEEQLKIDEKEIETQTDAEAIEENADEQLTEVETEEVVNKDEAEETIDEKNESEEEKVVDEETNQSFDETTDDNNQNLNVNNADETNEDDEIKVITPEQENTENVKNDNDEE